MRCMVPRERTLTGGVGKVAFTGTAVQGFDGCWCQGAKRHARNVEQRAIPLDDNDASMATLGRNAIVVYERQLYIKGKALTNV